MNGLLPSVRTRLRRGNGAVVARSCQAQAEPDTSLSCSLSTRFDDFGWQGTYEGDGPGELDVQPFRSPQHGAAGDKEGRL